MSSFKKGENIENKKTKKSNRAQVEGQHTLPGIDNTYNVGAYEEEMECVEETDIISVNENTEENSLELIRGGRFDAKLFHEQFEDNTEKVLLSLLEMQSNENPLKKGGNSIAFRCNAIIIQNRQNYTVPQNTLLDIITARMSANPENNYYIITAKELIDELPYSDKTYVYKIMSKACKELNRSPFIFEIDLDNGKKKTLEFQWNELLMYNGSDNLENDEDAYISFTPTKFFRILTLSSTIMQGAHYPIGVSAQISSKYARNLFYYLEDMKKYKEYPNATAGIFQLSVDELRYIIKYPKSYRITDIRRFVLDTAVDEINKAKGIDFSFNYEFVKSSMDGKKKKITHIRFIITDLHKKQGKKEITEKIEEKHSPEDTATMQVLKGVGLTDEECNDVFRKYKENNRDLVYLTQAITSVATTSNVKSKCALLCHIMDNGINPNFTEEKNKMRNAKAKNNFINFDQRDYDFDQLEKDLLESQKSH